MKMINLRLDKEFYDEVIKPIANERGITQSDTLKALVRKLKFQRKLSDYAVDCEIFKSENRKSFGIPCREEDVKLFEDFRTMFAPEESSSQQKSVKSNMYIKDELYGLFYNYSDDHMIELARKYGHANSEIDIFKNDNFTFYVTSADMEFVETVKSDYSINLLIQKYLGILNSKSYNIYKDIVESNGIFESHPNCKELSSGKGLLNSVRFSLNILTYKDMNCEAKRYFTKTHKLLNACLYYVKQHLEDFEDCKIIEKTLQRKHVGIYMYNEIIEKYDIKNSLDLKSVFEKINIDKLEEHVKLNKQDFLPVYTTERTRMDFIISSIDNADFYRLHKIRKAFTIGWADIVRVALEKDLLKK